MNHVKQHAVLVLCMYVCVQVGLTVLQYLVWVVQSMCVAAGSFAATKSGPVVAAAGPSEQVLAKKLLDLVKAAGAAEAAGNAWRFTVAMWSVLLPLINSDTLHRFANISMLPYCCRRCHCYCRF